MQNNLSSKALTAVQTNICYLPGKSLQSTRLQRVGPNSSAMWYNSNYDRTEIEHRQQQLCKNKINIIASFWLVSK